ncbi:hypothetical protein C8Q74DRAFT_746429 [Fomes fomentarius]|nr:hypothetical protein C8Q74DRAFT_746429 [Fomes fomentarius]
MAPSGVKRASARETEMKRVKKESFSKVFRWYSGYNTDNAEAGWCWREAQAREHCQWWSRAERPWPVPLATAGDVSRLPSSHFDRRRISLNQDLGILVLPLEQGNKAYAHLCTPVMHDVTSCWPSYSNTTQPPASVVAEQEE